MSNHNREIPTPIQTKDGKFNHPDIAAAFEKAEAAKGHTPASSKLDAEMQRREAEKNNRIER